MIVTFVEPAFRLTQGEAGLTLLEELWRHLGPLGLSIADASGDSEGFQLGRVLFSANLDSYGIQISLRLSGVEVWSNLQQVGFERASTVYTHILDAIQSMPAGPKIETFRVFYEGHGTLDGQDTRELIAKFVPQAPSNLGPSLGAAALFYFGPENDRRGSLVALDLSGQIAGGLLFRVDVTFDGEMVPYSESAERARAYVRSAAHSLGLELG